MSTLNLALVSGTNGAIQSGYLPNFAGYGYTYLSDLYIANDGSSMAYSNGGITNGIVRFQFVDHTSQSGNVNSIEVFMACAAPSGGFSAQIGTAFGAQAISNSGGRVNISVKKISGCSWSDVDNLYADVSINAGSGSSIVYVYAVWAVVTYNNEIVVTTQAATSISQTKAVGNGNITAVNGINATTRGICYSSSNSTPTTGDSKVEETGSFGTGAYTENLSHLTINTLYYTRTYAINIYGTSYGSVQSFTTVTLTPNTTYYVKAYATGVDGTGTGSVVSFTTTGISQVIVVISIGS